LNLLDVNLNHCLRLPKLQARKADVLCQVYRGREPELCVTFRVRHVDVNPCLLAGEKEESELAVAGDGGCHGRDCTGEECVLGSARVVLLNSARKAGKSTLVRRLIGSVVAST